ncbi:hypothetical protein [Rhodococcoides corynebacterioides]|uniref:hypothetical protein n=1 Tax=Rhodococcoides corynebacterioides TaxID=53972 RepID=UPI001114A710|nr:hypothetical protein [Rhodococcus corynebacterioides]
MASVIWSLAPDRLDGRDADVTTLLGMRTRAAAIVVALHLIGVAVAALGALGGVEPIGAPVLALAVHAACVVALVCVHGDPLPLPATLAIGLAGPASCALVLWSLPVPLDNPLQTWPIGVCAGVVTFLCVRGRPWWGWAEYAAVVVVTLAWATDTGQGWTIAGPLVLPSVALVLMGSFFAHAIRTPVADIFELRAQTTVRAAEEAAAAASLHERDVQLTRLDELARPLLTRIASGEPLADDERLACRLLESQLRDSFRARGLVDVSSAVRAARSRGVDVLLLDDRGHENTETVDDAIVDAVVAALENPAVEAVTVRLLPPDRDSAASILVDGVDGPRRVDLPHAVRGDETPRPPT